MIDNRSRQLSGIIILPIVLFLFSAPLSAAQVKYTPAEMVEKSAACIECHQEAADNLKGSKHQLTPAGDRTTRLAVGCIGCHNGWEKHLDDPNKDNIETPVEMPFLAQAELCGSCHMTDHQSVMMSSDPHARSQLVCTSCHLVHDNEAAFLVKDDKEEYCMTCHPGIVAQFKSRSAHPLTSGNIRCIDCHSLGDAKDETLARGIDWRCQTCHSDLAGPFVYEHPVTEKHLFNGGGCTECHNPHGSPNDRLLAQPGSGVCLQCHGIPPGHRTEHAGMGSKLPCASCHTEIHGSNDNSKFLDPQLNVKLFADCYHSGCHGDVR